MTPTDYTSTVAGEVRAEMARQQKNLDQLAKVLGAHRQTAEARFSGQRPFNVSELARVANWLGVPVRQLVPSETAA